jgi:hypothetical protein
MRLLPTIKRLLNWPPWLTFALIFALFFLTSIKNLDPDLGWHLRSGQYFLENSIPATDPFTYTAADFPYIDHESSSNILVYLIHSIGGHTLLSIIFAALWTLSLFIISHKKRIPGPLLAVAAISMLPFAGVRFVTFCVLFLSILIRLLPTKKAIYFIPLLIIIWVNFHGSFIIALLLIAYYSAYTFIFSKPRSKLLLHRHLAILATSILATFINPYGPRIYEEIWRQLTDHTLRWTISEWGINIPFATAIYIFIFTLSLGLTLKPKNLKTYFRPENCFLLAALSSQRHWPLFITASLTTTSTRLRTALTHLYPKTKTNPALRRIILATFALISAATIYSLYTQFSGTWDRESTKPKAAITYLTNHPCTGNLFNEYNDGGYLIWHLPTQKIFIDGRMPSWQHGDQNYMRTWEKIITDASVRTTEFTKYSITCALIYTSREDLIKDLQSKNWHTAQKDAHHTLLIKP